MPVGAPHLAPGLPGQVPEVNLARPAVITAVAIFDGILGFLLFGVGVTVALAGVANQSSRGISLSIAAGFVLLGLATMAAAGGLLGLRSWARYLQIGLSVVGLVAPPILGTVVAGLLLFYLFQPGIRVVFSRRKLEELTPDEAASVLRLKGGNAAVVAIVAVAVVFVGVAFVGIIAAIAIPSLLRARVAANEAGAIDRAREVVSAEAAFAASNGGFYGSADCLTGPDRCIPGYSGVPFLFFPESFDTPRNGYRATLHLGPPAPPEVVSRGQVSPTSVSSYVVTLAPVVQGQTGIRAFCADQSGTLCYFSDGVVPPVDGEACPAECVVMK